MRKFKVVNLALLLVSVSKWTRCSSSTELSDASTKILRNNFPCLARNLHHFLVCKPNSTLPVAVDSAWTPDSACFL
jgi:hypothetical protein